jgi:uncharacterized membrane protein YqgA involved in biofilm formation
MLVGTGTYLNTATVLAGGLLGLVLGRRFPERLRRTTIQALGLITFFVALRMMSDLAGGYMLHVVAAVLLGAVIGELLKIEQGLEWLGAALRDRCSSNTAAEGSVPDKVEGQSRFVEGFVVASMIFCVGPMTLLGTFEDGTGQTPILLYTKSAMDGVLAIALAATLGRGVVFSALSVLVFQGLLTILFLSTAAVIPDLYIHGIRAAGGLLTFSIGLLLLDLVRIRVANLLPALPLVCLFLRLWPNPL